MNNTCHLTEPTFPLCCVDQWAGRSDEFGSTHSSLLPHTHTHTHTLSLVSMMECDPSVTDVKRRHGFIRTSRRHRISKP